jgi:hypothetical protein
MATDDMQSLISDIDLLTSLAVSVREDEDASKDDDAADLNCPVCLDTPEEVHSCRSCGNLVCGR